MKIGSKSDANELRIVRDLLQQQEASKAGTSQDAERLTKRLKAQTDGSLFDQVDVSLSKAIGEELSPEAIAAERQQKIANLKQLIAEGKYNPPSEAVAKSVGEEILYEIFTGGTTQVEGGSLADFLNQLPDEER